ncbi:BrnT family toxin [Polaromonas glacialis]|uniref:BrnT family toxin n=1 Tax=Polaromonas glacialis TaxID=866564 RepID=UPI000497AC9E|nr:BrnT family toxin [Polaromonas glacialis]
MTKAHFEWDENKDAKNQKKHGVAFSLAQYAIADAHRVIAEDLMHSTSEKRYFCFNAVDGGILTVRFTWRGGVIRIFGAGYWRKGRAIYEQENQIQR